jgi:DNA-binding NtrC family response regulator
MTVHRNIVLVIDDDSFVAKSLVDLLKAAGHDARGVATADSAIDAVRHASRSDSPVAVALVDMALPGLNGLELIRFLARDHPDVVTIGITGYGTIEQAVKSVRSGAFDYLTKPLVDAELLGAVERAMERHTLLSGSRTSRAARLIDASPGLENIIGDDARMRSTYDVIEAVAPGRTTVLMCGESGTGKSLIARAIHRRSPRADKPFVEISCGSIPETLLESELFGHVKGAFTGAHADKPGRFLAAHGGTLFLDEINSASPGMQLKLLRVLQEKTFEPVGSNKPVDVDVRVILASNQPLEELVARGEFRQDLFYRINVVSIELPPLRERIGDIPVLAAHFLEQYAGEMNKQITGFTPEAMQALRAYRFPGNVRELENIVQRAVVLTKATRIALEDLPANVVSGESSPGLQVGKAASAAKPPSQGQSGAGPHGGTASDVPSGASRTLPLHKALEEPEKQIILAALEAHDWNRRQTAHALGINRTTLYKKIKLYDLERYGRTG